MDVEDDEEVFEAGMIFEYRRLVYGLLEAGVERIDGRRIKDDRKKATPEPNGDNS
jgi:hypothetical protein